MIPSLKEWQYSRSLQLQYGVRSITNIKMIWSKVIDLNSHTLPTEGHKRLVDITQVEINVSEDMLHISVSNPLELVNVAKRLQMKQLSEGWRRSG